MSLDHEIVRSSLRDQVLAVLRERLVSGELAPGEIYSAQAVAAEIGVSASPVREALLTLVQQRLMEPVRNRGFRVVPTSDSDRREIFELRLWLEVPAMGKLAATVGERVDEDHFRSLADRTVEHARAGDKVRFLEVDRSFHLGLLTLLGNERLVAMVENLRDQTRLYGLESLIDAGRLVDSALEHVAILQAVVAGDRRETQRLMTRHLEHVVGEWSGA